jgi:hypothetical protein
MPECSTNETIGRFRASFLHIVLMLDANAHSASREARRDDA